MNLKIKVWMKVEFINKNRLNIYNKGYILEDKKFLKIERGFNFDYKRL